MIARSIVIAVLASVLASPAWAYDVTTHDILSARAFAASGITIGKNPHALGINYNEYFVGSDGERRRPAELIRFGAAFEDGDGPCSSRPKHHFANK